jgi:hypothetical protein
MSASDSEHAGDFTDREVFETIGLLKWLWPEVEIRANTAMKPWLDGPLVGRPAEAEALTMGDVPQDLQTVAMPTELDRGTPA